ncbi:MAG: LytTR family DNA-binding domain-containing protein [Flavobacteriales bacterium]
MRTIRTIIVDDEVLGRSRIRKLLADNEQIQLVGEGSNGEEAIRLIEDYKPDLVFLDVEMPDKDGFQVVSKIPEADRPFVIFVTAHDRFALKAFDVQAIDFIHKPFDNDRFARALDHAIKQIEMLEQSRLNGQLLRIMDDYRSKTQSNPFVLTIKDRGREKRVNLYDVIYIEADGNYLKLQLEKERFLLRNTMQQMVDELDQACFLRIHRSIIININYLKQRIYKGNNEFAFKMRNGDEFVSGRSFKESIDAFFEEQFA